MDLVEVSKVSFIERGVTVLQTLSFSQLQGRKMALAGESGAGKSTLLQIIAGLVQPSTGEVHIAGSKVRGPAVALVPGHPGVAYLSQRSDLPKFLRVAQVLHYASKRSANEAQAIYTLCRIDHLLNRRTDELSGGEQQRVALARLLLGEPRLLLLDEPFSNLDRVHKRIMQDIIEQLGQQLGITCLLVSHDAADTLSWADEIMVLQQGRVVQRGTPEEIYYRPTNEYTASLFGDYNVVRGAEAQQLAPEIRLPGLLMVRPEQLQLAAAGHGLLGTVRAVRFFGSFYEVEIQLPENSVRLRASSLEGVATGHAVRVGLAPSTGWALPQ
jgi:ABC-type Fe3+/spermidine/putrescine transport system ATPase subunit